MRAQHCSKFGLDQIVVPMIQPHQRCAVVTKRPQPKNDKCNVVLPTDQTDETALQQVTVEAIETEEPYGKAIDLYARDGVSDEGRPKLVDRSY